MARTMNFSAGPAALPLPALERAREELLDIAGTGMSVMEHSHRGKAYDAVHTEALALVREIMSVPDDYEILLLQGGATGQFAMVPMNLLGEGQSADYIVTGSWSKKAISEAKAIGTTRVACTTAKDGKFPRVPAQSELDLDPKAAYVHMTTNNTIAGTQFMDLPETGDVPLIADMSSDIMWRPTDISKFGIAYAGAQKNLGPSGVVLVIIRKDLIEKGSDKIPGIYQYRSHAKANSMLNTPPTFGIYMLRNVLDWLKSQGGLTAIEKHNRSKAQTLYDAIAARPDFYSSPVDADSRSMMNVVFNLPTPELEAEFVKQALAAGMSGLKGHRSVGGIRASIYNACPKEWVEALAQFMGEFQKGA